VTLYVTACGPTLLQTAQITDHQLAPHVQVAVCLYLCILEL